MLREVARVEALEGGETQQVAPWKAAGQSRSAEFPGAKRSVVVRSSVGAPAESVGKDVVLRGDACGSEAKAAESREPEDAPQQLLVGGVV